MSLGWCAALAGLLAPISTHAVPPPAAAVSTASVGNAHWVRHRVIPGEQLDEIAERYAVARKDLIKWNRLNGKHTLRAGTRLRIRTQLEVPERERIEHIVQTGDTWAGIATHYGVEAEHLRERWNHKSDLQAGTKLTIWVDRALPSDDSPLTAAARVTRQADEVIRHPDAPEDDAHELTIEADYFPIMDVPLRSRSTGHPGAGRISHPVQLPENEGLYHLRDPERSYVSSHAGMVLQNSIARFRLRSGYGGLVLIKDTSRRGGGPLFPHKSHQSGRDADIQLLLKENTTLYSAANVDWDANWSLLYSMVESDHIRYIFLSWPQQRLLYRAARRAGMKLKDLEPILEYPKRGRQSIIRDEQGHDTHFHVRVDCAPWEGRCID